MTRRPRPENEELIAGVMQALNRPWDAWEKELGKRAEREGKLRSANDARQDKASADYRRYRNIASTLIADNPHLRQAKRYELARRVQAKLIRQGQKVSVRTIVRAFKI